MSVPRPLTPGTLWNRARDWNLSIFKSESFPNIHPCIPPFIFHSFEARTRWSIDMHLLSSLVHPIFITHVHAHTSFLLRRLYLFPSEGRREIIPSNISLRRTKFSKILLDFVPFRYLKILSRNIYIYISTVDQAIVFKKTIGGEGGLFATTWKLRGFERLGSKVVGKQAK